MKDIIACHLANKWLFLAFVLASIVCASLTPTANVSAQLCPERWEVSVQDLKDTYKPGENIDFTVNYLTRNPSDCSACRQQIIVGLINSSGKVIYVSCVYDGSPQTCPKETSGAGKISWKAPSDVGSYQILAANDYQNSCEGAKANFRVKSSNRLLSTIQVSTSSSATSSTKPAGSDTTGSNQNPFSTFQTWLQQMMKPSGAETTTTATTAPTLTPTSGSPITSFSTWFQQNQKAIFSILALIIIAVLGLRYLINRKRSERDKVITIILGAVALGYLLIIWIIIPIINFIIINWFPILITLLVLCIIAIIAWKKRGLGFKSFEVLPGRGVEDSKDRLVDEIKEEIKTFQPAREFNREDLYHVGLFHHLQRKFPDARFEEQRGSSRPDITIGDIALEIKGPTGVRELESVAYKCFKYPPQYDHMLVVLFKPEYPRDSFDEFCLRVRELIPHVEFIEK